VGLRVVMTKKELSDTQDLAGVIDTYTTSLFTYFSVFSEACQVLQKDLDDASSQQHMIEKSFLETMQIYTSLTKKVHTLLTVESTP